MGEGRCGLYDPTTPWQPLVPALTSFLWVWKPFSSSQLFTQQLKKCLPHIALALPRGRLDDVTKFVRGGAGLNNQNGDSKAEAMNKSPALLS